MHTFSTEKGQVVIPAPLRRKYGIKKGTRIEVLERNGQILLQPITAAYIRGLRGLLKGTNALQELTAERALERDREDGRKTSRIR